MYDSDSGPDTQPSVEPAWKPQVTQRRLRVVRDFGDGVFHLSAAELALLLSAQIVLLVGAGALGGVIGHAIGAR